MIVPPLIPLLVLLAIVGFLWYLLDRYVPMPQPMRTIIAAVVLLAVVLYLLRAFGLL